MAPTCRLKTTFLQPRDQFHEVAGLVTDIKLVHQDIVPRILAGAGGTGQGKHIGAFRNACGGAGLDRRADLLVGQHAEEFAETGDFLFETSWKASGVTSRPVTPVPPVASTASI